MEKTTKQATTVDPIARYNALRDLARRRHEAGEFASFAEALREELNRAAREDDAR